MISYQLNKDSSKRLLPNDSDGLSLKEVWYWILLCTVVICAFLPLQCEARRNKHRLRHGSRSVVEKYTCNKTINGSAVSDGYYSSTVLKPPPITSELVGERLYCVYSFHGVPGQRIMLKIREMSLGQFDPIQLRCKHAQLRLWDGFSEPGKHPYPPNTICGHISDKMRDITKFTTQSNAMIEYEINYARQYMNFELSYKFLNMELESDLYAEQFTHDMKPTPGSVSICDWSIDLDNCISGSECQILSPGYPGIYPPNTECKYRVTSTDSNAMIQINFQAQAVTSKLRSFNVRQSYACREDYLVIKDNNIEGSPAVARFCGKETNDIITTGNNITIFFVTAEEKSPFGANGFHLSVTKNTKEWNPFGFHERNSLCNWQFNTSQGSISTPDHWLPPRTSCVYTFNVQQTHFLKLRFNIYGLRHGCDDNIYIYDNNVVKSRLCDSNIPQSTDDVPDTDTSLQDKLTFTLKGPTAAVVYTTKKGQYQGQSHNGFWLSFQQMPIDPTSGGYGDNMVIEDMLVEEEYAHNNSAQTLLRTRCSTIRLLSLLVVLLYCL